MTWQDDALCATTDPDAFFPDIRDKATTAKTICGMCEVRTECLTYAIENREEHGVWGGTTEQERTAMWEPLKPDLARLDYDRMGELIGLGLTVGEVAYRLGCSTESVSRFRKRLQARDAA